MKLSKRILAAGLTILLGVTQASAAGLSPVGSWQSAGGETRYHVTLCGDGTELCAKLTWLRADLRTPENLRYLNAYVLKGAHQAKPDTWTGTIIFNGETHSGSVRRVGPDNIELKGCTLGLCKSVEFTRI